MPAWIKIFRCKNIKNQLQEDIATDQISVKEYIDPFTGSKETKA